jgi:hypothetical protein
MSATIKKALLPRAPCFGDGQDTMAIAPIVSCPSPKNRAAPLSWKKDFICFLNRLHHTWHSESPPWCLQREGVDSLPGRPIKVSHSLSLHTCEYMSISLSTSTTPSIYLSSLYLAIYLFLTLTSTAELSSSSDRILKYVRYARSTPAAHITRSDILSPRNTEKRWKN